MMRALAAALLVGMAPLGAQAPADTTRPAPRVVSPAAPPDAAPVADRWLGLDKAKHFLLAGLVQGVAFGGVTAAGVRQRPALVASSAVTAAVSVGKELDDRRRGKRASLRDLAWDAAGGVLWGVLVARSGR